MARNWTLTRTEAEALVDLLESTEKRQPMMHFLAGELRELFGMIGRPSDKRLTFDAAAQSGAYLQVSGNLLSEVRHGKEERSPDEA